MAKVNDVFGALNGAKDERTKRYITPKRVLYTQGSVKKSENLLLDTPNQIVFHAPKKTVLENLQGQPKAGVLIDFGIEFSGSVRLLVSGIKGEAGKRNATLLVRYGESVMEALTPCGVKNTTNDHATRDMTINVSIMSANETPESGFRFAYIELQDEDTALTLQAIKGCFYYRDLEYKGSFECSDERLNRIWQTAAYTVHLCMQQYLWDGIKRDRLVWIGDMHTEVQTILSVFGNVDIIAKSLDLGATTFFEDFNLDWVENSAPIDEIVPEGKRDIHGDFGAYCYKLFRHSLCHGWSSGPCPYMTHYVLGIRAKDKDTYIVAPELADLEWAKGSYPTDKGLITVSARKTQRGTEVEISAPEGITVVRA